MDLILIIFFLMFIVPSLLFATTRRRHHQLHPSQHRMMIQHPAAHPGAVQTQLPMHSQGFYGPPMFGGMPSHSPDGPITDASRDALDSDITRFGGELRDLDLDVVGLELDTEAQADYTAALDAYENAKQSLRNAAMDSDATVIAHMLEEGRYKISSVKARAHGEPVPQRRPPCFFDPAHGPSVRTIGWTPDGGVAREVPACALDAARVSSGYNPNIRMVAAPTGAMVPYWEDGRQAAWARGYYGSWGTDPAVRGLTQGALMIGGFALLMNLFDD